jgi:hypothetical protein
MLTEDQAKALKHAAKPDGVSPSALMRIFINEGLSRRKQAAQALK